MVVSMVIADGTRDAVEILQKWSTPPPPIPPTHTSASEEEEGGDAYKEDLLNLLVIFRDKPEDLLWLGRFVTAVQQTTRRLHKLGLWYYGVFFHSNHNNNNNGDDNDDDNDNNIESDVDAVERLFFGSVLPCHPSLTCLRWANCYIKPKYVELLATSFNSDHNNNTNNNTSRNNKFYRNIPASPRRSSLRSLTFSYTPLGIRGAVALGKMIRGQQQQQPEEEEGSSAKIETLFLENCGIQSQGFQALLESLNDDDDEDDDNDDDDDDAMNGSNATKSTRTRTNSNKKRNHHHLKELQLHHNDISEISLDAVRALGKSKNLRILTIRDAALTLPSIQTLAKGLRTNSSLEDLYISCCGSHCISSDMFEELLTAFNFTLRQVWIGDNMAHSSFQHEQQEQHRINSWVVQLNGDIRIVHHHLDNRDYHVPLIGLWPPVLDLISSKPSLLYRFLRHGNADAFSKQTTVQQQPGME